MKNSFNDLTRDELIQKKNELSEKLRNLRFQKVMGHIENTMEKKKVRKSIARINTILKEQDSGLRKA
jgi:large subunit ribosomal protein L29